MNLIAVVTFVAFLSLFALIGLSSVVQKKKTTEDYLLAGQDVKPWLVALATVATCNSGYMFIGMIGFTYRVGLASLWIAIGWVFGDFMASLFSFGHIRKFADNKEIQTVVYAWAGMGTGFGPLLTLVLLGKKPNQVISLAMILIGAGFTVALSMFGVPEPEYFIPGLSSGFIIYHIGTLIYPETKGVEEVS